MKHIHINSSHLGSIKQTHYLIRAIKNIMPDVPITIYVNDKFGII